MRNLPVSCYRNRFQESTDAHHRLAWQPGQLFLAGQIRQIVVILIIIAIFLIAILTMKYSRIVSFLILFSEVRDKFCVNERFVLSWLDPLESLIELFWLALSDEPVPFLIKDQAFSFAFVDPLSFDRVEPVGVVMVAGLAARDGARADIHAAILTKDIHL